MNEYLVENQKDWVTVKEFGEAAGTSEGYVRELALTKKINAKKCGKSWRIPRKEINRYLGIEQDKEQMVKDIYIQSLENKCKHLEFVVDTIKGNLSTLANVLDNR